MTLALHAYRALTSFISPIAPIILSTRVKSGKEDADRLQERAGYPGKKRPAGPLIWLHGASIGESQILLLVFEALREAHPNLNAVITTQTLTSADLIARKSPPGLIHQMAPLDTPFATERFLKHWRPDAAVFAEGDIWPNMLTKLDAKRIPRLLINARMTEKSFDGWMRYPKLAKRLFGGFDTILAANQKTGDALKRFAGRKVKMTGNIKYAAPELPASPEVLSELAEVIGKRPVFAALSTHAGEEPDVISAFNALSDTVSPKPLLILAPRHPERGDEIAEILSETRFYQRSKGGSPRADQNVWLCDTLGELGVWMRLANVVFLGGGRKTMQFYGHNPIEPLKLERFVISESNTANFAQEFKDLVAANAAQLIEDAADLAAAAEPWLNGTKTYQPNSAKIAPYLSGRTPLETAVKAISKHVPGEAC